MGSTTSDATERIATLERRAEALERRMLRVEAAALDAHPVAEPERAAPERPASHAERLAPERPVWRAERLAPERPASHAERLAPERPVWRAERLAAAEPAPLAERLAAAEPAAPPVRREVDLEQLLGGRVLAGVGGVAVLAGLALLFALAASRGWIGEGARAAIGGALSCGLVGLGLWLHERRGRTEAARAAVATGVAGMFMTVTVAAHVYDLVPASVGLGLAFVVGALAAALAMRWSSPTIGALGILGALLAPVLVDAPSDATTVAFVAIASASAVAVVLRQRWDWLALAVFALGAPQWLWWLFEKAQLAGALAALITFGVLYATAAMAGELRLPARRLRTSVAFLLGGNALVLGLAGFEALDGLSGRVVAIAWLGGLAAAHALAAVIAQRDRRISHEITLLCLTLAVLLADVGFAVATSGPTQVLGWAASAIGFAALARRPRPGADGVLSQLGLGGHIALAALNAGAQLDLGQLAAPGAETGAVAALTTLAAACLISGRLAADGRVEWRVVLDATGLLALAALAALTLDGAALAAAWAAEALALGRIAQSRRDPVALVGALAHLAAALLYAGLAFAPPTDLIDGGVALGTAALGLGAIAAASFLGARLARPLASDTAASASFLGAGLVPAGLERLRGQLVGAGAGTLLYLASLAVVAWAPGAETDGLLQQGQLQLSALWAVVGVGALVVGLRLDLRVVRLAALGLLGTTVAKVFLYDLAALTSVYRVASFIGLGLLLLLAAFAYQRLRPEAIAQPASG